VQEDNEFINVSSSGELKEAIKSQKPDLIILNSVLTDAPGWKLVQRIKGSRDFSHIPVLLMTGDPGGPPLAEVRTAGADGYLSKPIDGATLKESVESLLGLQGASADEGGDEEIMIDFTDEDSGEMTEELLAMSNVALESEEPSTDVGDTVEIDTGTLVAELDHTSEMAKDETYEDTVRLNLEDMGLDEELDSYEPTIELDSDVPADFGETASSEVLEIDLDSKVTLPDFESTTQDVTETAQGAKHSVTVEMDVDDLGLELESDEPIEDDFSGKSLDQIDPDDIEIGQILDVQEPSKVLTSEDLMLDDDSLVKEASVSSEFDVIDLEQDSEIREIEMEELEGVHDEDEDITGIDQDETVPVEDQEMELLANEDLQEIQIDDTDDLTLGLESATDSTAAYESTEELTLDEIGEEEITTQEFFGEELPTEEFPTERFPDEKTRDIGLEQVSLESEDTPLQEISLDQSAVAGETPLEEITLDAASAEGILFEPTREEEPMLEVTEDISFDEISLEDEAEGVLEETPVQAPRLSTAETIAGIAGGALAAGAAAAVVSEVAGLAEKGDKIAQAMPSAVPFTEPQPATTREAAISGGKISPSGIGEPIATAVTPEGLRETTHGPASAADLSKQIPHAVLPTKEELLGGIMQELARSLPTREEIFSRLDGIISKSLPSEEQIVARVDRAVQAALPSPETIVDRVNRAVQAALPSPETIVEPVDRAVRAALPSHEMIMERVDRAVQAALPSPETIVEPVDRAVRAALPSHEMIMERVDRAVQAALPSPETIVEPVDRAVRAALPSHEMIMERVDRAVQAALPSPETITDQVDRTVQAALPSHEVIAEPVERALLSMLSREEVGSRFEEALGKLLAPEELKQTIEASLKVVPSQDFVKERLDGALSSAISPELVAERVDLALRGMPSQEYIRMRLDNAFAALPAPDIVNERLNTALRAIPANEQIMRRIDESLQALTSPEGAIARVDDRLLSLLPSSDEISATFQTMLQRNMHEVLTKVDLKELISGLLPSTDRILETIASALPSRDRFQEALGHGIAEAVQNSLPEKVWLESVSRGLFDERTRGLIPKREEIVSMLREEIHVKLLDTVEKIIREQIESISSELS
jgi:pilus assembly protein FimV